MTAGCLGCINLAEVDGRLCCCDSQSRQYGAVIRWPGPGCEKKADADKIYGGGVRQEKLLNCVKTCGSGPGTLGG